jgi:uncharacterized membrane protein
MIDVPIYNHLPVAPEWVESIIFPLNRWLHIVATATLVGGTLFYEFVIPIAIEDLKDEQQLAVLGRVRWVFRQLVIFSTIVLLLTGAFESWQVWPSYHGERFKAVRPWWGGHVIFAVIAMAVAVRITLGDRVPRHPIAWMRVAFVIMLVAVLLGSLTRYVRLSVQEDVEEYGSGNALMVSPVPSGPWVQPTPSTTMPESPTTAPAPAPEP